ncbi:MAG: ribonuclease P protein component [Verrucomicrobiae bacterium]|nr:ribonuclease P protein component [Verrucomicrobiae bacterium]
MKLPRTRRITRRSDFQRVRTSGRSLQGRFLVLGYLEDATLSEPFRLGIITTKRLGGAVVRNRVRRRLRGILQRSGERILKPHWIVLIARAASAEASSEQLEKEWNWMLRRLSLTEPSPSRDRNSE